MPYAARLLRLAPLGMLVALLTWGLAANDRDCSGFGCVGNAVDQFVVPFLLAPFVWLAARFLVRVPRSAVTTLLAFVLGGLGFWLVAALRTAADPPRQHQGSHGAAILHASAPLRRPRSVQFPG